VRNLETTQQIQVVRHPDRIRDGKILEFAWHMKKRGLSEETIAQRVYRLNVLVRKGANLADPETVETIIATSGWTPANRKMFVNVYKPFCDWAKIPWTKPRILAPEKPFFIPQEKEIDDLIAGCGKQTSAILQLLKETGARIGEAAQLKWTDIDLKTKQVRITPEKGSNPRTLKISDVCIAKLKALPKREGGLIFNPKKRTLQDTFRKQKNRLAHKLQNPRLREIHFHTLRHWKGTTLYYKTKDVFHVKYVLGHKRLDTTQRYVHYQGFKAEEYVVKVAETLEEALELANAGFTLWDTFEGVKIYRKLK
jgi:integrase